MKNNRPRLCIRIEEFWKEIPVVMKGNEREKYMIDWARRQQKPNSDIK
jgi:hypothetical protein